MDLELLRQIALALGIGLLIGIQRERSASPVAGIRTFPLISLCGLLAALLGQATTPILLAAAFLAFGALVVVGHLQSGAESPGLTTEVAALLIFACGASLVYLPTSLAVTLAGVATILLHLKRPMHRWVRELGDDDVRAIMRFAVITFVVLPILPNRGYGPYDVLNPFSIWLMVVLIVSLNLAGYLALRLFGERGGSVLGGLLGGLVSSTATTVAACRHAGVAPRSAGVVIVLATAVMYVRVFVEILVVHPDGVWSVGAPFLVLAAAFLIWGLAEARGLGAEPPPGRRAGNPAELRSAILFGLLYGAILLAVAWAEDRMGDRGVLAAAFVGGLTDVDALTLSSAHLAASGRLAAETAFRAVLVASLSNLLFKFGLVLLLGGPRLVRRVAASFSVCGFALGGALWVALG